MKALQIQIKLKRKANEELSQSILKQRKELKRLDKKPSESVAAAKFYAQVESDMSLNRDKLTDHLGLSRQKSQKLQA